MVWPLYHGHLLSLHTESPHRSMFSAAVAACPSPTLSAPSQRPSQCARRRPPGDPPAAPARPRASPACATFRYFMLPIHCDNTCDARQPAHGLLQPARHPGAGCVAHQICALCRLSAKLCRSRPLATCRQLVSTNAMLPLKDTGSTRAVISRCRRLRSTTGRAWPPTGCRWARRPGRAARRPPPGAWAPPPEPAAAFWAPRQEVSSRPAPRRVTGALLLMFSAYQSSTGTPFRWLHQPRSMVCWWYVHQLLIVHAQSGCPLWRCATGARRSGTRPAASGSCRRSTWWCHCARLSGRNRRSCCAPRRAFCICLLERFCWLHL